MNEISFLSDGHVPLRGYLRAELAQMYFPDYGNRYAVRKFSEMLRDTPALRVDLSATGYRPHQRFFLRRQVEIIFNHVGEP